MTVFIYKYFGTKTYETCNRRSWRTSTLSTPRQHEQRHLLPVT